MYQSHSAIWWDYQASYSKFQVTIGYTVTLENNASNEQPNNLVQPKWVEWTVQSYKARRTISVLIASTRILLLNERRAPTVWPGQNAFQATRSVSELHSAARNENRFRPQLSAFCSIFSSSIAIIRKLEILLLKLLSSRTTVVPARISSRERILTEILYVINYPILTALFRHASN